MVLSYNGRKPLKAGRKPFYYHFLLVPDLHSLSLVILSVVLPYSEGFHMSVKRRVMLGKSQ